MDGTLHRSSRSTNRPRAVRLVGLLAAALLVAVAGPAAADPATPTPTLATTGPIGVGSVLSWNDPAPQPGYALVGSSGGDEYTCPAGYGGGTVDDDPDTIATCSHRGAGSEYTVLARDAGLSLFYVRSAAPTPFQPGGCCVYYWSAPLPIPIPSSAPVDPVPAAPVVPVLTPAPAAPAAPVTPVAPPAPAAPTVPPARAVTIGPSTVTPASLTPTAAQDPTLVIDCSATCTATLSSKLQLGSVPMPWTGTVGVLAAARVTTTTLKTQTAKLAAGHRKRLTIHLSSAQHRAIRKALAAHHQARVLTTIRITGQPRRGQVAFVYRG